MAWPYVEGIALGRNQDGRLELVASVNVEHMSPGAMGEVWHLREAEGGGWPPPWRSRGLRTMVGYGRPAIARNKDGRLEVAVTTGWELLHSWQTAPNGTTWRTNESLGHPSDQSHQPIAQEPPALARNRDGRLEAFVLENRFSFSWNGPLWHIWQRATGGWSPWESLGAPDVGNLFGRPVVASNKDGRLEVFMLGADRALWHIWQQAKGGWSPWSSLGTPDKVELWGQPVEARNRDGRLEAFARGADNALWHIWQQSGGGWSPWASLEGPPSGSPSQLVAGAHADGRLVVFAVSGPGDPIWQREQAVEGGWSPWRPFPRPYGSTEVQDPVLALGAGGLLQLWLRIHDTMQLHQLRQTTANGTEWEQKTWDFTSEPAYHPVPAESVDEPT